MVDHLTECPLLEPCSADTPEHGFCSRQNTICIHCERQCICDRLRACEERVQVDLEDEINLYRRHANEAYAAALDAAREAVDRLASEMANWSSAETVAATGAVPDLTADQWMWAQRGVWRALAAIDVLREEQK